MEQVARLGRTLFVNNSKATNAEAAAPALSSFPRIYWIAGGLPKEGGIASLSGFFPRIAKAYLIGEAAPQFAATLGDAAPFEISGTISAAVDHAARDAARDGSAVNPWCCCRRPVPVSTNFRTLKNAATHSAPPSLRLKAQHQSWELEADG